MGNTKNCDGRLVTMRQQLLKSHKKYLSLLVKLYAEECMQQVASKKGTEITPTNPLPSLVTT